MPFFVICVSFIFSPFFCFRKMPKCCSACHKKGTHRRSKIIVEYLWNIFRIAAAPDLDRFFGPCSTLDQDSDNKTVFECTKHENRTVFYYLYFVIFKCSKCVKTVCPFPSDCMACSYELLKKIYNCTNVILRSVNIIFNAFKQNSKIKFRFLTPKTLILWNIYFSLDVFFFFAIL